MSLLELLIAAKNTQNCFAYNSATKYRSEAVLYSKPTSGYPLSPHIKTIAVAFLQADSEGQESRSRLGLETKGTETLGELKVEN